jgi:rSAM/selenodomain-associated transferase 1
VTGIARGALLVFAKEPVAGQVKTRMVPPLSPQQAADLYAALLRDVLIASGRIALELGLTPTLAVHPADAVRVLARSAPTEFRVVPQRGANLGARMAWAIREVAASGADRILLRGSDSPVLDRERIAAALACLDAFDLVVSPDLDGGYNLIGLRRPAPGLFDHPMSTRTALDDTLANAAALGLRAKVARPSFDIDTADDLALLAAERAGGEGTSIAALCPHTLAFLDAERLWP